MKKLLLLSAFLIFSLSFGQRIVVKTFENKDFNKFDRGKEPKLKAVDTLNITEFKDKFISVGLGDSGNYLSTKNYKNIVLHNSLNFKSKWNVYDGDNLIQLVDEVDVLNFFHKYGYEFFKTASYVQSSVIEKLLLGNSISNKSLRRSPTVLIFKNNNN